MPPILIPVAAVVVIIVMTVAQRHRARSDGDRALATDWGGPRPTTRDLGTIATYHQRRIEAEVERGVARRTVDDRTWADLTMDEVFALVDRTDSLVGQQALYARLRGAPSTSDLPAFDALATHFADDVGLRLAARRALARLGAAADASDLIDLTAPGAVGAASWHVVFPLIGATMACGLAAMFFWPPALFAVIPGILMNLGLRATVARDLRVAGRAFRQIHPLLTAADALVLVDRPASSSITGTLRADVAALAPLRRVAAWAGRDTSVAASGELSTLLVEYFNLVFCLDGNALYFGARHLAAHGAALLRVVDAVGAIDAAASVANYRAGVTAWTRPVFGAPDEAMSLVAMRHPLVAHAVPNTIALKPPHGVLVTGSNMSGKSTFLRTLGVSVLLAQAIATCEADGYEAPWLVVRTCIGLKDDLTAGKSYYLVEVESVLDLVAATRSSDPHLLLFDELFRGTNAVERIAAGEAVLATLLEPIDGQPSPHVVVGATHDRELVDLLADLYAPFHFSDRIDADGLSFDYRLVPGPATTRNAIALLQLGGAPTSLVSRAMARAAELDRQRGTVLPRA